MTTKSKSPKPARDFTPHDLIALEVQKVIDPFGWKVDANALPHLQAAEIDAVSTWLDDAWAKTPLAVWRLIVIPNTQWIAYFKNPNDVMAIASTVLSHRGEFNPPIGDPVKRLIDSIDESGAQETRFGWIFLETDPELLIWFGRKAGKTPNLFGDGARTAIRKLFNPAVTAPAEPPATVEKPKSTARRVKPAAKSTAENAESAERGRCDSSAISAPSAVKNSSAALQTVVPLSTIQPNPANHRKTFDKARLQELADSIKQHGILQPLLLRLRPDADPPYQIIAGERRYRAAQLAGLQEVPAQIVEREGVAASLAMLEENIRREDLSPIERANAIRTLMDSHGLTQKEVGKMIGVTQGQVSNELRLLQLPPTLQQEVAAGTIAPTLIRSVLPYTDLPDVLEEMTAAMLADGGPYTEQCLEDHLSAAILKSSRSMEFAAMWQTYQNPDAKQRHFKDPSAADLKLLDVRKVEAVQSWQGQERTFNVELFDRLNSEPLAARRKKHAAWKAKHKARQPDSGQKGKAKTAAVVYFDSEYRLRDAIEESLCSVLADALERSKDKTAVFRLLLAYAAVAQEGSISDRLLGTRVWGTDHSRKVIDSLTGTVADMQHAFRTACSLSIRQESMPAEDAYSFAAVLGIDRLWEHWTVTPEVLATLTDAGRAEFADTEPGHIPEFLRPFFGLKVDAEPKGKAKKSKAA